MKKKSTEKILKTLELLSATCIIVLVISMLGSCDEGDKRSPQKMLCAVTWKVSGGGYAKFANINITTLDGLELKFNNNGSYTSINGATTSDDQKVFLPQGSWRWVGNGAPGLERDEIHTEIVVLTKNSLVLKFTITQEKARELNGRTHSISGAFEIAFVPKR